MPGLAETGGGLLLALGLVTPLAAARLFGVMLVAAVTFHIKKGFFAYNGAYEYTLVLGVAALTLAFTGPGSLSLDALFRYHLSGALWGTGALFIGVIGGVAPLVQRRQYRRSKPQPAASHDETLLPVGRK